MAEHVEDRILGLAEKATPGPYEAEWDGKRGHHLVKDWRASPDTTVSIIAEQFNTQDVLYAAACSPEFMADAMKVIAAARKVRHHFPGAFQIAISSEKAKVELIEALDAWDSHAEQNPDPLHKPESNDTAGHKEPR